MAILFVTEFSDLGTDGNGQPGVPAALTPAIATSKADFTSAAASSATFNAKTRFVRLYSDTAGYVKFGAAPTAVTATDMPIAANAPEIFAVIPGQKVSIVQ